MTLIKRADGMATMERLRDAAMEELASNGVEKFNLDDVLERADAARSSLYHHFGNKSGLIEAAQLAQMKITLSQDNEAFRATVEACKTSSELVEVVRALLMGLGKKPSQTMRRKRVSSLAAAEHSSDLGSALRRNQVSGTTYFEETLQIAKDKCFIDPVIDLRAIAYWIQGQFVGRILLDISKESALDDAWAEATLASLIAVLRVQ